MSRTRILTAFLLALAAPATLACASGCHKSQASETPSGAQPPPGEAWLTPQQVREAKIETSEVNEQNVDDTIVTSGKVDLRRSARRARLLAGHAAASSASRRTLGERVKKGDALAVIESPDIGVASSDVGKAKADLIAAEHDFKRQKELFEQPRRLAERLETSRGQLPQGEGRARARAAEGAPPPRRRRRQRCRRRTRCRARSTARSSRATSARASRCRASTAAARRSSSSPSASSTRSGSSPTCSRWTSRA